MLRRFYAIVVEAEKQKCYILCVCVYVCVSSLRYPASNAHAPYCHLWPVMLYYIFHIISQTVRFSKEKVIKANGVFSFSLQRFSFYEEWSDTWSKMYTGLHVKCSLFLSDSNETWIAFTDFRKTLKYQIWSKSFGRNRVIPCGETDGQTDVMKLILVFRNFANAPKIWLKS